MKYITQRLLHLCVHFLEINLAICYFRLRDMIYKGEDSNKYSLPNRHIENNVRLYIST